MGIREELNEALQVDDFPSPSLLARTMGRLDEPPAGSRRWQAIVGVAAVLLAGFAVGAIRFAHVGHHQIQPAVTSEPVATLASAQQGLMVYKFVSPEIGWVSVFRPDGHTAVAKTTDGGRHWEHQLQIDWVYPGAGLPVEFLNTSVGFIAGQQQGVPGTVFPPTIWVTTDGGTHWAMRTAPSDSGRLLSFDFIDAGHGWLMTSQDSTVFLYKTVDGGRQWTRVASSETSQALAVSGLARPGLKFVSPTEGWLTQPSPDGTGALYATRDGGRTWELEDRPAKGVSGPGSRVSIDLPTFFSGNQGVVAITVTASSSACPSAAPSSTSATCVPPIRYVSLTDDAGQTWSMPRRITIDGSLSFTDNGLWIASGAAGISVSGDAGFSWSAPRQLPQPAGWGPIQVQVLDLEQGWMSLWDWPEGEGRRIATYGAAAVGSTGPLHIRISGTPPRFALLKTEDGGVHWSEVQLAGID